MITSYSASKVFLKNYSESGINCIHIYYFINIDADSDSDLVSPEGKDTIDAHVDIIQERYDQIAKFRMKHQINYENPFRPEGELSKEAETIVDAIQSGNCQNIQITPEGAHRRYFMISIM